MKRPIHVLLAVVLVLSGLAAHAGCVYPQAPQSLPNGSTATKDEMVAAKAKVTEYQTAVEGTYLPCLNKEKDEAIAALDPNDPQYAQQKVLLESVHAKKYNAAVDELTAVAGQFNDEIKAFKAKAAKQ
jgi:hypothetical protein